MRHGRLARALCPMASLALLGAALGGCGLPDGRHGGGSGYHSSPSYHRSHRRSDGHRHSPQPRVERWSQQRLQQHWLDQARKNR